MGNKRKMLPFWLLLWWLVHTPPVAFLAESGTVCGFGRPWFETERSLLDDVLGSLWSWYWVVFVRMLSVHKQQRVTDSGTPVPVRPHSCCLADLCVTLCKCLSAALCVLVSLLSRKKYNIVIIYSLFRFLFSLEHFFWVKYSTLKLHSITFLVKTKKKSVIEKVNIRDVFKIVLDWFARVSL